MDDAAHRALKKYFGYDEFRRGQDQIITRLLDGDDTIGIMPTGGGKSLCYQIPALLFPGVTLVISPLISLMKDQVDALGNAGIQATFINSSLSFTEGKERLTAAARGKYKLVYIAPERLEVPDFVRALERMKVSLVAIDEAHCISQWGHDFRPSYRSIPAMITRFSQKPVVVALTATATPNVTADICQLLGIAQDHVIATGFARDNLNFQVIRGQSADVFLFDYLKKNQDQPGIVYAATRKEVDRLSARLAEKGLAVGRYHAGLSEQERAMSQERFLYDDLTVLVATNAFGMGINKSNVRFVIHYNMPRNIEAYYQEAGRAGRDGEKSDCILLFSPQDIRLQKFFIDQSEMDDALKHAEYHKLEQMIGYCHTETCLQGYILRYFGDKDPDNCGHCGNCLDTREQSDVTIEAQKVLSCVKRLRERYGKMMVAKVLAGASDQKVKTFHLNRLSTYGIMQEQTQKQISEFIDFLTAEQYLVQQGGAYPVLALSDRSLAVLKGEAKVYKKGSVRAERLAVDDALFETLKQVRKALAQKEYVPPYIIFSDQSLREMSARLPSTDHEFLMIKGVGQQKLEKYGQAFMKAIAEYQEAQQEPV
ncbi:DNA helicase RecQ [Sporolactobacillus terrae]|uniref:DNA helicase RecQ n=1 Tax=Sporolactobacillus terrae TaxID=269673 RepID=A0A410DCI1_9BACL|nr:DNA helicase RecQ [Sporolactobacillus terrae]QAA23720.1 DNA helicase RecQ [Sporolactobacillus terrae]QAA26692.1 DNA helicase RecQ [Sporolactobacillus terrae]UAK18029.1 DNA helicase RecQ [Sporolactobacillus terrae]BBO00249.1 ATP-dependent DNA helicase RecQ [Sporolactobacillus terrae]